MAKGLRSKSKRRFRTLKRQEVVKAPEQLAAEAATQEQLAAVLAAPRPSGGEGVEGAGPAAMEGLQQGGGDAAMAVDGEGTSITNPAKLLKKLRKQRMAATKGIVKGQKKRANPLAGANQFHKKHKKKR
ncbi:polyketide cyclase [Chlorella sorokiniana]|uniref:Polyketide cyclase n=1 Tax=Chlorella sorokiniana TaxID=3076 RepID=A0A2P6TMI9_CHLSO|nr:polyketide cyclase [Chlorella sorokiniana]|eukprot:PRW45541.1 polyketide cyclase [Chlorella sorokiniana]